MGTSAARGLTNMAVGKNKRLTKAKKKIIDPFASKDWYDIKAPSVFTNPICGKTLASRTKGTKLSSDALKGRVCEVSLGDLKQNEDDAYRKIRLRVEDVQGKQVLCNFWGMDFTTDKLRSLVRKWQSLIEANVDVKTVDGYVLRCFCIGSCRGARPFPCGPQMSPRKRGYSAQWHTACTRARKMGSSQVSGQTAQVGGLSRGTHSTTYTSVSNAGVSISSPM